ncbi:MAG: hypothetical protein M9894_38435 [Planctomycetes bacterium]|nr:hypothetical protein [Planctomycetota bacterium]
MKRLVCLLLLAGCASAPAPAPEGARAQGEGALVDPWLTPDAGLVAAFKARFEALAGAPACQAALVRDEPEHAHALFLQAEGDGLRRALADAFARRRPPEVGHLDSERARAAAPEVHARGRVALTRATSLRRADPDAARAAAEEARAAFAEAGDALLVAEAWLLAEPDAATRTARLTAVQQVQAAVLAVHAAPNQPIVLGSSAMDMGPGPFELAATLARDARHATALLRLEEVRQDAPYRWSPDAPAGHRRSYHLPNDWSRTLAQATLERRMPLQALRHAATLVREQPDAPAHDRLLLARAHHLAAQTEAALAEALQAVDDAKAARDLATEAGARALVAEVLVDLGRPDAAAEEFDAAERLFLQAGDPEGRLRQAVNRAGVLVRARRLDDAEAALAPVRGLSLPGEAGADLACRRDVTAALLDLVAGRAGADEAVRRVEQALDVARAGGAYRAVEQYGSLPGRLRPGGS